MKSGFIIFLLDENGQSVVEYGLIIALIALAAIIALGIFGAAVRSSLYDKSTNSIPNV
ncbi:Flp pilus assembly protein, pilin Flp [Eubacterium uniforme]|uniref:Flp pilus assembly protein, pilin Flp n=1 Tax=Eubacterium uniforme TaxID=39495 RepID=A0A1T4VMG0_9FIRM|nr:Flp family type IVb pilin [Eubacterium uniforme]SKA66143.1 Flp pilus assembly protein, pilin Flp [Eubacterium uniforme]